MYKKELKTKLAKVTNGHCSYCGINLLMNAGADELHYLSVDDYSRLWSVDHIVPLSRDGEHHVDNMVICCKKCNSIKGTKTLSEFRLWLQEGLSKSISKSVLDHFLKYSLFYGFSTGEYAIIETGTLMKKIKDKIGDVKFYFERI